MKKGKLKIAMLCKSLPWSFKGGIQTHTWTLSKELHALGHGVSIISAGSFLKGKTYIKEGIEIIEIPYFPGRYLLPFSILAEELFFNLSLKKWLSRNEQEFDIIHMQGRTGYLAKPEGNTPFIQTIHGLLENELSYSDRSLGSKFYKLITAPFEKRQIKLVNKVLTVNEDLKKFIVKNRLKKKEGVKVIPNGLVFDYKKENQKSRLALTFIGRLTKIKNVELLIVLMQFLPWDISLNIIGSGPLKTKLEAMARKSEQHLRINFYGDLNREQIDEVLSNSMALVLPSFHETQGIVLLEAAANSVPSIASDIPAIRECVKHGKTGFLCEVNNLAAFRNAVLKFYKNPSLSEHLGLEAKSYASSKFDLKRISKDTLNAYYETIAA